MELKYVRDEYVALQLRLLIDGIEWMTDRWPTSSVAHFQPWYVDDARRALTAVARNLREAFGTKPDEAFPPDPPVTLTRDKRIDAAAMLVDAVLGICPTDVRRLILDRANKLNEERYRLWVEAEQLPQAQ